MDGAPTTMTPPSRRSEAYLLRDRPPPTSSNLAFHELSGDDDMVPFPAAMAKSPLSPSPRLTINAANLTAAQERLLLLSHSPVRRRRSLALVQEENLDLGAKPRRRSKNRSTAGVATVSSMADMVLTGCASPRNTRRARRRLEKEIITRDERPSDIADRDVVKVRRRRQTKNGSSREEKPSLILLEPRPSASPGDSENAIDNVSLDGLKEAISELIMWKNFAKSSLWFGLGTLCFASSCLSRGFDFCIVSAVSNLGLLLLAVAFIRDSVPRRNEEKARCAARIKEEDILRVIRLIMPVANAVIAAIQEIFSGEPSMTLAVAPVLLFTAKYGHCITLWRLLAAGFFIGFTVPKLYSTYSTQIHRHTSSVGNCLLEGWEACRRRRILGVSATLTLWNLLSVKTRVIAGFTCLVALRYYRQRVSEREGARGYAAEETTVPAKQENQEDLPAQIAGDTAQRSASEDAVAAN